jgi:hypothetical protein
VPYGLQSTLPSVRSIYATPSVRSIYATLPPLAALLKIKAARPSELRKPNKNATDEGPIWPADSRGAGNSPETYTIPEDKET